MSKIITIAGQKGGTGKTVTAVNVSASLALMEKKTLLIDFDPQASSTIWFGEKKADQSIDIATVLSGRSNIKNAVLSTRLKFLDMITSGFNLFKVARRLATSMDNEKILYLLLKDIQDEYDYIIIDSPSSYGFLSISAFTAAQWLLVCMTPIHNTMGDFECLLKTLTYTRHIHQVPLKISGFLFNRCSSQKAVQRFLKTQGLMDIEKMVFKTVIPEDRGLKNASDKNLPLALYDIKSPAASAYLNFSRELHIFLQ